MTNANEETPKYPITYGSEYVFLGTFKGDDLYWIQKEGESPRAHVRHGMLKYDCGTQSGKRLFESSFIEAGKRARKKGIRFDLEDGYDTLKMVYPLPNVSTGSRALNFLIGGAKSPSGSPYCPGFANSSITHLCGDLGAGQREVALQAVGECLKNKERVVWIGFPGSKFDKNLANRFGCSVFNTLFSVLDLHSLQECLEGISELGKNEPPKLLVFDLLGANSCEHDEIMKVLTLVRELMHKTKCAVVALSSTPTFSNIWTFYAATQLFFAIKHYKFGDHLHVEVTKNKRTPNKGFCLGLCLDSRGGIDDTVTLVEVAIEIGEVSIKFGHQSRSNIFAGHSDAIQFFKDNPKIFASHSDAIQFFKDNPKELESLCKKLPNEPFTPFEKTQADQSEEEKDHPDLEDLLDRGQTEGKIDPDVESLLDDV